MSRRSPVLAAGASVLGALGSATPASAEARTEAPPRFEPAAFAAPVRFLAGDFPEGRGVGARGGLQERPGAGRDAEAARGQLTRNDVVPGCGPVRRGRPGE